MREENRLKWPQDHNAPVRSFGPLSARLLIVGLAPGLRGANRTGRPFTGDFAGLLLYQTLHSHGFAHGEYQARADDGFCLSECRVTNAVRCVPPENKPIGAEVRTCRQFLAAEIAAMPNLAVIVALGNVAHRSTVSALSLPQNRLPFSHGALRRVSDTLVLADSYHCSRYNTNTGKLTPEMFSAVFSAVRSNLDSQRR